MLYISLGEGGRKKMCQLKSWFLFNELVAGRSHAWCRTVGVDREGYVSEPR